jgi:hypothetical protein
LRKKKGIERERERERERVRMRVSVCTFYIILKSHFLPLLSLEHSRWAFYLDLAFPLRISPFFVSAIAELTFSLFFFFKMVEMEFSSNNPSNRITTMCPKRGSLFACCKNVKDSCHALLNESFFA